MQQSVIIVFVALQGFAHGTSNLHNDCIAMLGGSIVTA